MFFLNEDVGIQNVAFTLDADTQTVVSKEEAFVQATVTTAEASTEISKNIGGIGTMTDDLEKKISAFCIKAIKDNEKAITYYKGFPSYLHLMICWNFLGAAVNALHYNVKENEKEATFMGRSHSLTPLNKYFLLCVG